MIHDLTNPLRYWYTFGPNEPAARISPGDSVVTITRDANGLDFNGAPMPEEAKQDSETTLYLESNPLVGPIYVEGADPGDSIAIRIERIQLNRDFGWSSRSGRFGALTGEVPGKALLFQPLLDEQFFRWTIDLQQQTAVLEMPSSRLLRAEVPLHPFVGSIGVAPRFGRVETTLAPGEFGGNMDSPDVRPGSTLYLPVWVKGAYLQLGDVHAAQGDGELMGGAIETTAEIRLRIDLIKSYSIQWPRLEDVTHIMVLGSARPLMDAVRVAHVELLDWMVTDFGFDSWEALQLLTQVGTMRVCNVVDPNYTVAAKFPKRYLPLESATRQVFNPQN